MYAANRLSRVISLPLVLILLALACSLPGQGTPTPVPKTPATSGSSTPGPTPTPPPPLPPALVETDPPAGSVLPLTGSLTFYFNQSMDRLSVEGALTGQPGLAGRFTWQDDSTLVFAPDAPFLPDANLTLSLNSTARAANGLALLEPVSVSYQTAGFLRLSEVLPRPGAESVNPTAAVVATFNQPVVPLGTSPGEGPAAFSLSPETRGSGEWLNTSTYIYYPVPALIGGVEYTVTLNPELAGVRGGPLAPELDSPEPHTWTFTTASPRLLTWEPDPLAKGLPLDAIFRLEFNQPMDPDSVSEHLGLFDPQGAPVSGLLAWGDDFSTLTYKPDRLLARASEYLLLLDPEAQAAGGASLDEGLNIAYQTVSPLAITGTDPVAGGRLGAYRGVQIRFNGPLASGSLENFLAINPAVPELSTFWDAESFTFYVNGFFEPETDYLLSLDAGLADPWGGILGKPFQLAFRTESLPPDLTLAFGSSTLFLTPEDSALSIQATNLPEIQVSLGTVPLDLFIRLLGPGGYELFDNFQPEDTRGWTQSLDLSSNQSQFIDIPLSPDGQPLTPGLYFLRLNAPGLRFPPSPLLLVVSDVHLTFKLSAQKAFLWAVDLQSIEPLVDLPIILYHEDGSVLADGPSGPNGVMETRFTPRENPYETIYAVSGTPGDPRFSLALSSWEAGVSGWEFGIPVDLSSPGLKTYIYTDRPIYRPGQTVYFRAVLRYAENGRYRLPEQGDLLVSLLDDQGQEIRNRMLPLSAFGTAHGEFALPDNAAPGHYQLETQFGMVSIQVAEFRKPEIDVQVSLEPVVAEAGQTLLGNIQARYFFGAPAADVSVEWAFYSLPSAFSIPGYQVGPLDTQWLYPPWVLLYQSLGQQVGSGQAQTGPDGSLDLLLPTESALETREYTLEVTIRDESGLPASYRSTVVVHPGPRYIGVRPDAWIGQAGQELVFEVLEVGWDRSPVGDEQLQAEFQKVEWVADAVPVAPPNNIPTFIPQYTAIDETAFFTNSEGQASLSFTPPEPGTYQLTVRFGQVETQVLVWVGGTGQAVWPALPNQQIRLTADKDHYQAGETAEIFIPNSLGSRTQALITIERGEVMRHQVITLEGSGVSFQLPLEPEDAPNIYLSVTLLGRNQGLPDFRQGYLNLLVDPLEETLHISLSADPVQTGPGEDVTLSFRVMDQGGNPVQGEFSLALVDRATLALAEPNAPDITSAFYGEQPLGVRNSLALAAYARRRLSQPGGVGGGGDGQEVPFVREDFQDTAYWQADLVTGPDGEAQVTILLPDNLTTWQVDLRGLTADSRVGQAEIQVVATKDLLVRPETPRFLVVGDHVQLAAIVHNNTGISLETQVSLQPTGISLDDPGTAFQTVVLAPGDRQRLVWWGVVEAVPEVDLVFSAQAPGYGDAARPETGSLPVRSYTAVQTFATAGTLLEAGERLELVSLPRTFLPAGGELRLELAPSLAAAATEALASLEAAPYESNEQLVSRFLASLELFQTLQTLGLEPPGLEAVMVSALADGLARLGERQNTDGGWSWWPASRDAVASDPYVTAYVLLGFVRARDTGIGADSASIERAIRYIQATIFLPQAVSHVWELDQLAFRHFVLAEAGVGDLPGALALYEQRARLNSWGSAFLTLALESLASEDERAQILVEDLQTRAVRLETGAFWPLKEPGPQNMDSTVFNSAVVVYALSKLDPAGIVLPDAVRYLMAARDVNGGWHSSYETAWGILAMSAYIRGTGEVGADFFYRASLNDLPLADSQAAPPVLTPIRVAVPLTDLLIDSPNALRIQRDAGPGRLYYRAYLQVAQPVESIVSSTRGLEIERSYRIYGLDCRTENCASLTEGRVGELISVHLTLALENDTYYLLVEDYLPAGSEIVDFSLETSQLGLQAGRAGVDLYDPARPFQSGWGWWWFSTPQIYPDRTLWSADFLPAGTYELTYTMRLTHAGTYRVLPARAWGLYFPEIQGRTGGALFSILP